MVESVADSAAALSVPVMRKSDVSFTSSTPFTVRP